MIIVVYSLIMLSIMGTRFLIGVSRKVNQPRVYKNDHDTTHARYAVNENGYLEKISGPKVTGQYID